MSCPTCKELGAFDDAAFCGKECFQGFWPVHKLVHKRYKEAQAQALAMIAAATAASAAAGGGAASSARASLLRLPRGFEDYSFSGKLRPAAVSEQMTVPPHIARPDYAETGIPRSELEVKGTNIVPVLDAAQIAIMREACALGREVLDLCARALRVGATGDEIDRICFAACVERRVYPSPLNYHGFPKSLCTSVNEAICHGIPDARPLADGDIVNLDVSIFHRGFHADLNETYFVGRVDEAGRRLVQCSYECLQAAVAICRPGTMYRDAGDAIQKVAARYGFSVVRTYCGHGVGKLFHCAPNVPHYARNKAVGTMRPGHVFTIEPMINEGSVADEQWPDGWTAVTRDGKRSAQFEHTLLITEDGVEVLTARVGDVTRSMADWRDAAAQAPFAPGGAGPGASAGAGAGAGAGVAAAAPAAGAGAAVGAAGSEAAASDGAAAAAASGAAGGDAGGAKGAEP
jgi:methionyl aminopeptidase